MSTVSKRSSGTQITQRGVAGGRVLVDPVTGLPIDVIEDNAGVRRLAVDAVTNIGSINLDLEPVDDGVHIGDASTGDPLLVNPDGSINVNVSLDAADDSVSIGAHDQQIFDETLNSLTTTTFEEIYSYISTGNNTKIVRVECTAETPCTFRLKVQGNTKKIRRSSSLERNVIFEFKEHLPLLNAEELTVEARVERLIKTNYETFTSLEGYLE